MPKDKDWYENLDPERKKLIEEFKKKLDNYIAAEIDGIKITDYMADFPVLADRINAIRHPKFLNAMLHAVKDQNSEERVLDNLKKRINEAVNLFAKQNNKYLVTFKDVDGTEMVPGVGSDYIPVYNTPEKVTVMGYLEPIENDMPLITLMGCPIYSAPGKTKVVGILDQNVQMDYSRIFANTQFKGASRAKRENLSNQGQAFESNRSEIFRDIEERKEEVIPFEGRITEYLQFERNEGEHIPSASRPIVDSENQEPKPTTENEVKPKKTSKQNILKKFLRRRNERKQTKEFLTDRKFETIYGGLKNGDDTITAIEKRNDQITRIHVSNDGMSGLVVRDPPGKGFRFAYPRKARTGFAKKDEHIPTKEHDNARNMDYTNNYDAGEAFRKSAIGSKNFIKKKMEPEWIIRWKTKKRGDVRSTSGLEATAKQNQSEEGIATDTPSASQLTEPKSEKGIHDLKQGISMERKEPRRDDESTIDLYEDPQGHALASLTTPRTPAGSKEDRNLADSYQRPPSPSSRHRASHSRITHR